ncbi:retrovirus-related pol polyprotein from transposon TNT 1-94 [Tanacetum coccineum]
MAKASPTQDQLCSSCEVSKAKRSSFKTKAIPSSKGRLNLLHIDLCGPMRVASINRKKYILMIQRNLQAQVIYVRTDRGIEFLNKTLHAYFKEEGIEHQTSTPRSPEQMALSKDEISKGYRVYNKRTRLIVESIHIKFDEIKEMASAKNNTLNPVPQRQEMSVDIDSACLIPQEQLMCGCRRTSTREVL